MMSTVIGSEQGWQAIETVPQDGTYVVAARFVKGCKHVRYGYAMVDRWHGRKINPADTYEGLGRFNKTFWPATHWMPLHPAPETK